MDTVRALLDGLDDQGRLIAELTLEGYSAAEIAPRVGLTERTVYRYLDRIRKGLMRLDTPEAPSP